MKKILLSTALVAILIAIYIFFGYNPTQKIALEANNTEQNTAQLTVKNSVNNNNIVPKTDPLLAKTNNSSTPAQNNTVINPQNIPMSTGVSFIESTWGDTDEQLGKSKEPEANSEGPMSVKVDSDGNLWILDQVNKRLKKLDTKGKIDKIVTLDSTTLKDFEVDDKGNLFLLDRVDAGSLKILRADGDKQTYEFNKLFPDNTFAYSQVILFKNSPYIEKEHDKLFDINNPQNSFSGRPSPDGSVFVKIFLANPAQGKLFLQGFNELNNLQWETPVKVEQEIFQILLLDFDISGNIYLAFESGSENQPGKYANMSTVIAKFNPQGSLLALSKIPATTLSPEETSSPLALDKNTSQLYQMTFTDKGTSIKKYKL